MQVFHRRNSSLLVLALPSVTSSSSLNLSSNFSPAIGLSDAERGSCVAGDRLSALNSKIIQSNAVQKYVPQYTWYMYILSVCLFSAVTLYHGYPPYVTFTMGTHPPYVTFTMGTLLALPLTWVLGTLLALPLPWVPSLHYLYHGYPPCITFTMGTLLELPLPWVPSLPQGNS